MKDHATPWGPAGRRAALSITMDNLGEPGEIALGLLPKDGPHGGHFTATEVVPRLLKLLKDTPITYFIEGINATVYPEQVRALAAHGHDVGLHAWQHEGWGRLRAPEQVELTQRSLDAMAKLGIRPTGFRPPGGDMSADALATLHQLGFEYCSPLGSPLGGKGRVQQGLAILPFQWRHVDAYLMDPKLAFFRANNGLPEEPVDAARWAATLDEGVAKAIEEGEHLTVIFHAHMVGKYEAQWNVFEAFIAKAKKNAALWVANGLEVSNWIHSMEGRGR